MRKWLSMLTALTMLLTMAAAGAGAEETEWQYNKYDGYVNGYSGPGGAVTVPAEIGGKPVTRVQGSFFEKVEGLTSVTFPEGVISLGEFVLNKCESLESVTLPQSLQAIDQHVMYRLKALKEVTIPANVRFIDINFLSDCEALEKVTFEGKCPFFLSGGNCLERTPDSLQVTVPEDQIEAYRAALTSLKPEQIAGSGKNAPEQNELAATFRFDAETGTVTGCETGDAWVTVPAEIDGTPVRAIGDEAFRSCEYIYGAELPEGLETIGAEAFSNCRQLGYVSLPDSVTAIGERAFAFFSGMQVHLPAELTEIAAGCFYDGMLWGDLQIPDGVKTIGDEAFYSNNLGNILLPAGLERIGAKAFGGWGLDSVHFGSAALPEIAGDAFAEQSREIAAVLPWTATLEDVQAAQDTLNGLGQTFTVSRETSPEGEHWPEEVPEPEITEAPAPETTAAGETKKSGGMVATSPAASGKEAEGAPAQGQPDGTATDGGLQPEHTMDEFVGLWYEIYVCTGGATGDPREMWDLHDTLELRADGTGRHTGQDSDRTWEMDDEYGEYGLAYYDGTGISLLPDGYLQWGGKLSGYSIFSRDPEAVWDPETPLFEDLMEAVMRKNAPAVTEAPATAAPAAKPAGSGNAGGGTGSVQMDVKYTCVSFISGGYEMNAATLGTEYAVTFHGDGTAAFIMSGQDVPGLHWTQDGDDLVIDYFGTAELRFRPAEEGIRLDFFGSMDMLMVPAE